MNILQAGHDYQIKQGHLVYAIHIISNVGGVYQMRWDIFTETTEYDIDVFHSDFKVLSCLSDPTLNKHLPCQTLFPSKKDFDPDRESLIHKYGKGLLAEELRSKEIGNPKCCELSPFIWRPSYGVYTELPIYTNSSLYYFDYPPKMPGRILFIPDIVIFHQGYPKIIIEVVHKNPPSDEKIERIKLFAKDTDIELHTVKASHIMGKVKTIDNLITTQIF